MFRLLTALLLLTGLAVALPACNTAKGIGRDTKETADWVTGTPRDEAFNREARDF